MSDSRSDLWPIEEQQQTYLGVTAGLVAVAWHFGMVIKLSDNAGNTLGVSSLSV